MAAIIVRALCVKPCHVLGKGFTAACHACDVLGQQLSNCGNWCLSECQACSELCRPVCTRCSETCAWITAGIAAGLAFIWSLLFSGYDFSVCTTISLLSNLLSLIFSVVFLISGNISDSDENTSCLNRSQLLSGVLAGIAAINTMFLVYFFVKMNPDKPNPCVTRRNQSNLDGSQLNNGGGYHGSNNMVEKDNKSEKLTQFCCSDPMMSVYMILFVGEIVAIIFALDSSLSNQSQCRAINDRSFLQGSSISMIVYCSLSTLAVLLHITWTAHEESLRREREMDCYNCWWVFPCCWPFLIAGHLCTMCVVCCEQLTEEMEELDNQQQRNQAAAAAAAATASSNPYRPVVPVASNPAPHQRGPVYGYNNFMSDIDREREVDLVVRKDPKMVSSSSHVAIDHDDYHSQTIPVAKSQHESKDDRRLSNGQNHREVLEALARGEPMDNAFSAAAEEDPAVDIVVGGLESEVLPAMVVEKEEREADPPNNEGFNPFSMSEPGAIEAASSASKEGYYPDLKDTAKKPMTPEHPDPPETQSKVGEAEVVIIPSVKAGELVIKSQESMVVDQDPFGGADYAALVHSEGASAMAMIADDPSHSADKTVADEPGALSEEEEKTAASTAAATAVKAAAVVSAAAMSAAVYGKDAVKARAEKIDTKKLADSGMKAGRAAFGFLAKKATEMDLYKRKEDQSEN